MKRLSAALVLGSASLFLSLAALGDEAAGIIPRPQVAKYGRESVRLDTQAAPFTVSFQDVSLAESAACKSGLRLLSKRLDLLGAGQATVGEGRGKAQLVITRSSPGDLSRTLGDFGAGEKATGKRLEQAYALVCQPTYRNRGAIRLTACSDLGMYYGLVSLCQLLDKEAGGRIWLPAVRIADWPEIGLRLSKTSASTTPLAELYDQAELMPLYKLNVMGLQFHGTNSNDTETFRNNVQAVCTRARQSGVLETVVYFCPFRGKGYDFRMAADQQRYAQFLQWMLDQGADGIEVDYNDWPGRGTPIEDVINLACRTVAEKNPQASILYCPPSRGASSYRGPASAEMTRILSQVPTNVWPLWTGRATLIEQPLSAAEVQEWTRAAGRRPFLWINRVGPRDGHNHPFMRPVSEVPGAGVFRGDLLPKELNQLFEGVHFNTIPVQKSDLEMLAYLATAADYVWNPRAWEPVDSCRRARRFVEIMVPLMGE